MPLPRGVGTARFVHTPQTAFENDAQCVRSLAAHVAWVLLISVSVPTRGKTSNIQT